MSSLPTLGDDEFTAPNADPATATREEIFYLSLALLAVLAFFAVSFFPE